MSDIPKDFVSNGELRKPIEEEGDETDDEDEDDDEQNSDYVMRLRSRHHLSGCVTSIHAIPAAKVEHRNPADSECLLVSFEQGKVRRFIYLLCFLMNAIFSIIIPDVTILLPVYPDRISVDGV